MYRYHKEDRRLKQMEETMADEWEEKRKLYNDPIEGYYIPYLIHSVSELVSSTVCTTRRSTSPRRTKRAPCSSVTTTTMRSSWMRRARAAANSSTSRTVRRELFAEERVRENNVDRSVAVGEEEADVGRGGGGNKTADVRLT